MLKEIKTHRDLIADLCRRYGVKRLELFGSVARGTGENASGALGRETPRPQDLSARRYGTVVNKVGLIRLWTFDETLVPIVVPGGQQAEQKKPLQNLSVVVHRLPVHAQVATERTAIKQRAHPPGYLLFKASADCGLIKRQIEGFTAPSAY